MQTMKDSGIEWIGQIPEDWKTKRIKEIFREINERCNNGNEYTLLSVSEYYGVAPRNEKISSDDMLTHAASLDGYKICRPHDIVMNIMLAWKRALGVSDYLGIISPAYCVYRAKIDIVHRYFHYLFRTEIYANLFKQYSTGIIDSRLRLYPEKFLSLNCHFPEKCIQSRIADFLDDKCGKIDRYIEKQQQIIEKLKKYKQSVITEAVTKGLNPGVLMKNSGLKYDFAIPSHWENRKVISILDMRVVDGAHESPDLFDEGIPYISATAIENGKIDFSKMRGYISEEYCAICDQRYKPALNDILMIKLGASTGQVAMIETTQRFNIWVPLAAIRCNQTANPKFIYYALQSDYFIKQMELSWTYGTQQTLGVKTIERLRILLPPLDEQEKVANYLSVRCKSVDSAIDKYQSIVNKLDEYKKSLIYEAVTGKVEV